MQVSKEGEKFLVDMKVYLNILKLIIRDGEFRANCVVWKLSTAYDAGF
ncbi:hypothetical protein [Bacillus sp. S10(2024)]